MSQERATFLLSPARCDGERARMLLDPEATFDLARRIRQPAGAPLGDVFSFLSGLYFRGKLAYARAFGTSSRVITTNRGLLHPETPVVRDDLLAFAAVDIAAGDAGFRAPLERDARRLDEELDPAARMVLLGSIATGKYTDVLLEVFAERLLFPSEFVGRGDMSRGGLLLRRAREERELEYVPVLGAVRRGRRPPKLDPLP